MKLTRIITPRDVFLDLGASTIGEALQAVAERVSGRAGVDAERIEAALLERERLGSTSVGGGFAIPHCKLAGLREIYIALCRFSEPVDFGGGDSAPVTVVFVVLSPPNQPAAHLQVLSQIARILKRRSLREELLAAGDAETAVEAIQRVSEVEGL